LGFSGALISAVKPWIAGFFVADATGSSAPAGFWALAAAGAAAFAASEAVSALERILSDKVRTLACARLQEGALRAFYREPYLSAVHRPCGERLHSLFHDASLAAAAATSLPKDAALLAFKMLLCLSAASFLDLPLTGLAVAAAGVGMLLGSARGGLEALYAKSDAAEKEAYSRLGEDFSRIAAILSMRLEARFARRAFSLAAALARLGASCSRAALRRQLFSSASTKALAAAVTLYGLYRLKSGGVCAGDLTAVMLYLTQLIFAQRELADLVEGSADGMLACARVDALLGGPRRSPPGAGLPADGSLGFKGVSFSYPGGKPVFEGFSFEARAGSATAVAGPSGCGKTTAVLLGCGLLEPMEGEILFGGSNLRAIPPAALRGGMAVVLQEPQIWDASIEDNVRMFSSRASRADFELALRVSGADGLRSEGRLGRRLSRGQRQRVALARALALRPRLLLLDEALSSLEPESELRVLGDVRLHYPACTLVLATHRAEVLARADWIVWIQGPGRAASAPACEMLRDPGFRALYSGAGS
jgi:ABC-type multidrug transport system fused ATPase/permease subunit